MKDALLSTFLHLLELVIIFGAVYFVLHFFMVDSATADILIGLAVAAVVKFARSHEDVPFKDYVNN